jgi:hypothetical protein
MRTNGAGLYKCPLTISNNVIRNIVNDEIMYNATNIITP